MPTTSPKPPRLSRPAVADPAERLARLESELAALTRKVAVLDATLRLRDPILLRHGATDPGLLATQARIEAQDHLDPDSGFHPLEYALDGTAIRWTGPGRESRLMVFVHRGMPILLRLGVHDFAGIDPATLVLSVDGDRLPLRPVEGGWVAGPWASLAGVAPTDIAILVPATTPRPDANGVERSVGIAWTHLEIGPA